MPAERSPSRRRLTFTLGLGLGLSVLLGSTCTRQSRTPEPPAEYVPGTRQPKQNPDTLPIYVRAFAEGWHDYGWAPRTVEDGKSAKLELTAGDGWILAHPGSPVPPAGVTFKYRTPSPRGDFLAVRLHLQDDESFPKIKIGPEHRVNQGGWEVVFVPQAELNPERRPFDRVRIYAYRNVGQKAVELDEIQLVGITRDTKLPLPSADIPTPERAQYAKKRVRVSCDETRHAVSGGIFGIAYSPRHDDTVDVWGLSPTGRRWGGNPASRYNFKLGNAWNTGADWYFENVNYRGDAATGPAWQKFMDDNQKHDADSAVTLPLVGWVAKDTSSYSFSVKKFGAQEAVDPYKDDPGNGIAQDGSKLRPGPPTVTSTAADDKFLGEWVKAMAGYGKKDQPHMYILGNEPMLWHDTHRDVHPDPADYDEVLKKSIEAIVAIRAHDEDAVIAGPAVWGWPAYFNSAKDVEVSTTLRPDRRLHGDVPFLRWYVRELKQEGEKRGMRMLDVLDVHFYPQGDRIYSDAADFSTAGRRIRSVRGLWDQEYVDESWIDEPIYLLPRLKALIAEEDPRLKLSLGEWSFGGEKDISGALAMAEALGRMAEHRLDYAYYWTYPEEKTKAWAAFRAFTNYDGKGARFASSYLTAAVPDGLSVFPAQDAATGRLTLVVVNPDRTAGVEAELSLKGCPTHKKMRTFALTARDDVLVETSNGAPKASVLVAPYSVNVIELTK